MRTTPRPFTRRCAAGAALLLAGLAGTAQAETIYAITGTDGGLGLVSFDSATPGTLTPALPLTGIAAGQLVRAIDFRPRTRTLYALAHNNTTDLAQLYVVNVGTGAATAVGPTFALVTSSDRISIDFNPVVDRIRVVASDGTSMRVNPETGGIAGTDMDVAFGAGDPNAGSSQVVDVAYDTNYPGATTTTLFAYDYTNDVLATIGGPLGVPSPNSGEMFTIGTSGFILARALGMDISDTTGIAYVSASINGGTEERLYRANLATGALTLVGSFGATRILDIAVQNVTTFRNGFE